jgi:hypothetical protein
MAYAFDEAFIVDQPIDETVTVASLSPLTLPNIAPGTIRRAKDPVFGEGEFIYLLGVASTTVGAIVNYDVATTSKWQTELESTEIIETKPLAIAMSANLAASYGWYQISGLAVVSKLLATSMVVGTTIQAAAGEAIPSVTSKIIHGAVTALVASANTSDAVITVQVMIQRPTSAAIA